MKKVIIILLFVITLGAGVFGTLYFYNQNKNQIASNQQLMQQNSMIQSQLDSIGAMTTVYQVNGTKYSGNKIMESDLVEMSVPQSTISTASITNKDQLIGRAYKVDVQPGTILSWDMLMEEDELSGKKKFWKTVTLTSVPVGTLPGDYIDLRIIIPSGEEYPIVSKLYVEAISETSITVQFSEEENACFNAAIQDWGNYEGMCLIYCTKYIEPGNANTISFYPVQHEMENYIRYNPNIDDDTRCINTELRNHIDEIFLTFTNNRNENGAKSFIAALSLQYESQLEAHNRWIEEHTDAESGELVVEGDPLANGGTTGSTGSGNPIVDIQQSTGEAMEDLENSIQDLEAIQ